MELNELRSRMHLDIMAAVQEIGRPAAIRGIHTDVRLP